MLKKAEEKQKESDKVLNSAVGKLQQAKETALDTHGKLVSQKEKLLEVEKQIYSIEDTLERSKKIMISLVKDLAHDRVIWLLCFVLLASIAIAIYLAIKNDGNNSQVANKTSQITIDFVKLYL